MALTRDLILTKFKRYSKLKRYYRMFKNPDLKMYFDAHLYRNLLFEAELGAALYTFPAGASLAQYEEAGTIDVINGTLRVGEGPIAESHSALKESSEGSPNMLAQMVDVFTSEEWGFVGVFLNVDGGGLSTAILEMSDGSDGYFKIEVDAGNLVTVKYRGFASIDDGPAVTHTSLAHDLAGDNDVYVFATVRDGQIMVYINGELALNEEYSGHPLSPVLVLVGGNLSSMFIDNGCEAQVGLMAAYSCALDANEKARFDKLVFDIFPDEEFDSAIVPA